MRIISTDTGKIYVATTLWEKTRGVIGREELLSTGVFVIPDCNWVHTFFLHSPLYVYFFSSHYSQCVDARCLRPNRISPLVFNAHHVVESQTQIHNDSFIQILRNLSG